MKKINQNLIIITVDLTSFTFTEIKSITTGHDCNTIGLCHSFIEGFKLIIFTAILFKMYCFHKIKVLYVLFFIYITKFNT